MTRTFKLTLSYDGSRFVGWQRQADGLSIQGLLEDALARLERAPVVVHGAGRTDAGVHATGQVASVQLACAHDPATIARAVNGQLPGDVRVTGVEPAAPGFHARYDARSKTYRYVLRTSPLASPFDHAYVWHVPVPLDTAAMRVAAAAVVGTHDFAAFQSTGSDPGSTVRTIGRSEFFAVGSPVSDRGAEAGALLAYEVDGTGFLRHMVRAIMGTLVDIGRGRWPPARMAALLSGGRRADAGATAPARGLFLRRVDYD